MEISATEFGAAVAAVLTAIGTVIVTVWKYVLSPAITTLKTSIQEIGVSYEAKIKELNDELKLLKREHDTHLKELRQEYNEKLEIMEVRHSVQIEKMDNELLHCQEERENALLWKARYEFRIEELEKATLAGIITAVPDKEGHLIISTANLAIAKILGYTRSELVGKPVEDLVAENFKKKHREKVASHSPLTLLSKFNRIINGGMAVHKDGSLVPVTVELNSTLVNGHPGWSARITME